MKFILLSFLFFSMAQGQLTAIELTVGANHSWVQYETELPKSLSTKFNPNISGGIYFHFFKFHQLELATGVAYRRIGRKFDLRGVYSFENPPTESELTLDYLILPLKTNFVLDNMMFISIQFEVAKLQKGHVSNTVFDLGNDVQATNAESYPITDEMKEWNIIYSLGLGYRYFNGALALHYKIGSDVIPKDEVHTDELFGEHEWDLFKSRELTLEFSYYFEL